MVAGGGGGVADDKHMDLSARQRREEPLALSYNWSGTFSSTSSGTVVQLVIQCTEATGGATGEEFDEITCSSPEFEGETSATNGTAVTVTAATAAAAATAPIAEILRR